MHIRTCIANTAAMSLPLLAADDDSDVTVAARGYSPPTPAPSRNLRNQITTQKDVKIIDSYIDAIYLGVERVRM